MTPTSVVCAFAVMVAGATTAIPAAECRASGGLVGVPDDATGQPVAGAAIVGRATNTNAVTPASGAISFAWLGAGMTILAIRKIGCAEQGYTGPFCAWLRLRWRDGPIATASRGVTSTNDWL